MKLKLLSTAAFAIILSACSNFINEGPVGIHDDHLGIKYQFTNEWEPVHGKEIDITGLPDTFALPFRAYALWSVSVADENSGVKATILDTLEMDHETGKILNKPIYDDRKSEFLQRVEFETNGEKVIKLDFRYGIYGYNGVSSFTLVRK